jgi:CheY-like chemotaxis protein
MRRITRLGTLHLCGNGALGLGPCPGRRKYGGVLTNAAPNQKSGSQIWHGRDCAIDMFEIMKNSRDTNAGKRVLLVDDERLVRETIRLMLAQSGYTVVEANNGAEALGLFRQSRFDLVMTDYEMPFVKGNELASRIRSVAPDQPILMMTGYSHRLEGDNPVNAVINKPLSLARLQSVMGQLIGGNEECEEPVFAEIGHN